MEHNYKLQPNDDCYHVVKIQTRRSISQHDLSASGKNNTSYVGLLDHGRDANNAGYESALLEPLIAPESKPLEKGQ